MEIWTLTRVGEFTTINDILPNLNGTDWLILSVTVGGLFVSWCRNWWETYYMTWGNK